MRAVIRVVLPITLSLDRSYQNNEKISDIYEDVLREAERRIAALFNAHAGSKSFGRRESKIESVLLIPGDGLPITAP